MNLDKIKVSAEMAHGLLKRDQIRLAEEELLHLLYVISEEMRKNEEKKNS